MLERSAHCTCDGEQSGFIEKVNWEPIEQKPDWSIRRFAVEPEIWRPLEDAKWEAKDHPTFSELAMQIVILCGETEEHMSWVEDADSEI